MRFLGSFDILPIMKKIVFGEYLKGKKITVMGLGLLGGALNDAIYLAKHGADLTVTDLKTAEQLKSSIDKLKKYKIKYVLGEHRLEDFRQADLILQPGNVPMDSPYLAEARKNNIPIYVSESLFAELVPESVILVGVTGTRGKSTVTQLVYEILKKAYDSNPTSPRLRGTRVHLGGNVKSVSTLALLDKIEECDIVVMELDSWALHGMGDIKKSPNVAVFTNLMTDHQNFYKGSMEKYFADKANIYRWQMEEDTIIVGDSIAKKIKADKPAGMLIPVSAKDFPRGWKTKMIGEHNLLNASLAISVARAMDVDEKIIKQVVANFAGVPGRLELIREVGGVKYYNDTTATTPDGALAAFRALKKYAGKLIILGGGADKELDFKAYAKEVGHYVKELILFKGQATEKILKALGSRASKWKKDVAVVDNMKDAFKLARGYAKKGDIILLSPGAASFGVFRNEFDRGEQFVKLVEKLK